MEESPVQRSVSLNRAHWNEIFSDYISSPFFPIDEVVAGGVSISQEEVAEIGPVVGLEGIHLQAGIGLDTISLSRLGARMTGADISSRACVLASMLAARCRTEISFIEADVMNRSQLPQHEYDFVYTSHGVLRWLPRLDLWANNVASLLKSGGWLYMFEIHPLVFHLVSVEGSSFMLDGNYFDQSIKTKIIAQTHLGSAQGLANRTVAHVNWSLSSIMQALIDAGLRLSFFHEHAGCSYTRKGLLPVLRDKLWWSEIPPPIPLSFSLRAIKD